MELTKSQSIYVRIPKELHERLKSESIKNFRTINIQIREILLEYFKKMDKNK